MCQPYIESVTILSDKSRKIHGTLLRANATYCVGVAECPSTEQPDPLPKGSFWVKDLAMR